MPDIILKSLKFICMLTCILASVVAGLAVAVPAIAKTSP